jgi:alkylation response protein AidB-like acyl-CoA dehydrogenase
MISFDPTDDEKAIRDEVRKFAEGELRRLGRECEKSRAIPPGLRKTYADLGLATLDWPEAWGGAGLSAVARALVEEELARGDAGLAIALDLPGFAGLAARELASAEQAACLLPRLAQGNGAALALAEADLGSEAGHLSTTAEPDGAGGFRLTGRKLFVFRADEADLFLVFARGDAGGPPRAFVVERGASGLAVGREDDRIGLGAARSFELTLDGARVPAASELRPEGDPGAAFDRFLARLWVVNAARQVGIARAATEYAVYYAQERQAFGKKIGQFQGVAFKIADMAMDADSARWLVWRAAWALDRGLGRDELLKRAALAAAHANEAAIRCAIDCVQVLGGAGFVEDYPAEKWMREARALAEIGGNDPLRGHLAGEREFGPLEAGPAVDPAAAFAAFGRAFGGAGGA